MADNERIVDALRKVFMRLSFCEYDRDASDGFCFFLNSEDIRSLAGRKIRVRFTFRTREGFREATYISRLLAILYLEDMNFSDPFEEMFITHGAIEHIIKGATSEFDTECNFQGDKVEFLLEKRYIGDQKIEIIVDQLVLFTKEILKLCLILRKLDEECSADKGT